MTNEEGTDTVWGHLEELRSVLIKSLIALFGTTLLIFACSNSFIPFFLATVPQGTQLVALSPQEGFLSIFRLSLWFGLLLSSPYISIQWLHFLKPALRTQEKKLLPAFLLLSFLFISAGLFVGFYFTIPLSNATLSHYNQSLGSNLWSIAQYIDYIWILLFAHAIAFELGALFFFLIHLNIISSETLKQKRRQAFIACLILGAILTPPDILSQVAIALPLYLFYELALLYGSVISRSPLPSRFDHAHPSINATPQSEIQIPPRES